MSRRNRHGFDDPAVILSSGPSHSRAAEDGDPPYEPPRQPLGFTTGRGGYLVSTPRDMPRGVLADLRAENGCYYPHLSAQTCPGCEIEPLLWAGDQA